MRYLVFLFLILPCAVFANPLSVLNCFSSASVYEELERTYGETALFFGIGKVPLVNSLGLQDHEITVMTFAVNQQTGSWSILYDFPNGITCVSITGTDFSPK